MQAWQDRRAGFAGAVIALAVVGLMGTRAEAEAADERNRSLLSPSQLDGSMWYGEEPHRRVTVTTCGDVDVKEGKHITLQFLERIDDIFVIEVRWWNREAGLNVLEHGVLTQIEPNEYFYVEADHQDARRRRDEFPGIVGQGTFELLSRHEAKIIQIGNLIDGSASGFTTTVTRVDELPEAPVELSYPRFCED